MASDVSPQTHEAKTFDDWMVYLGRPNKMIKDGVNADMIFDEMDIWYAHKDFIGLWPKRKYKYLYNRQEVAVYMWLTRGMHSTRCP